MALGALAIASSVPAAAIAQPIQPPNFGGWEYNIDLFCEPEHVQIRPGLPTYVWKYRAESVDCLPETISTIPNSYVGPVFRFRKGDRVGVRMVNDLSEPTITHWHGLDVPSIADGHPKDAVPANAEYAYTLDITNRAGTYWFHPHPDRRTANQVFSGMAGVLIVTDEEEQAATLPRGEFDLPLVLQDRRFNADNSFNYVSSGMIGFLGNVILVNGQASYVHSAATRAYRLRFVNGSNVRIFKLAWDDGSPMTVIGTDGGLTTSPVSKPYIMLSPGERVEVWADFRSRAVGSQVLLRSQSFQPGSTGGPGPSGLPQGTAFDVMRFSIDRAETETLTLPSVLSTIQWENPAQAVNTNSPRQWGITFQSPSLFVLNGGLYNETTVAPNEIVRANDLEVVEFSNDTGQTQFQPHPMHIHGRQFKVISRTINPAFSTSYVTVNQGFTDEGWKDTVLVMPGEKVQVLIRWSTHQGLFLYHCHNLEHEDSGMMRNFRIDP